MFRAACRAGLRAARQASLTVALLLDLVAVGAYHLALLFDWLTRQLEHPDDQL